MRGNGRYSNPNNSSPNNSSRGGIVVPKRPTMRAARHRHIPRPVAIVLVAVLVPLALLLGWSAHEVYSASRSFQESYQVRMSADDIDASVSLGNEDSDPASSGMSAEGTPGGSGAAASGEGSASQADGTESAFELDTYIDNRELSHRLYIYDMDYVDLAIDFPAKSLDDFVEVVNENPRIGEKFKPLVIDYCTRVFATYPDVELRPFYRNLQDLEIIECTETELLGVALSVNAVGCYVKSEDKIYVLQNKDYKRGTWDYQVIFHELSHCLRDSRFTDGQGNIVVIQFDGLNYWDTPNSEAINSLFAVSLFDYEERDVAYQFQSNAHQIMIGCMDNYTLADYVNHSLTYYAQQLDAYNHDTNYATTILALMASQYDDYHDDSYEAPQSTYYPFYDYILRMYLGRHLSAGMSRDEAEAVLVEFLDRLLFDVPEAYHVDTDHFRQYFEGYCSDLGIA